MWPHDMVPAMVLTEDQVQGRLAQFRQTRHGGIGRIDGGSQRQKLRSKMF